MIKTVQCFYCELGKFKKNTETQCSPLQYSTLRSNYGQKKERKKERKKESKRKERKMNE